MMRVFSGFMATGFVLFVLLFHLDARAGELDEFAEAMREANGFTGLSLAAVLPDGRIVTGVAGMADAAMQTPMAETHFMLAGSTGKVLFAHAALLLMEEGAFNLDDPVSDYLGDYGWYNRLPNADAITIRMLMNHTSGIPEYLTEEFLAMYSQRTAENPNYVPTMEDRFLSILDSDPATEPGANVAYADSNYILLAMILEAVTGQSAYDIIEERILTPYELTGLAPQRSRAIDRLATGHWQSGANLFGFETETNRLPDSGLIYNPAVEHGGGGWASTPSGLASLARLLYGDHILSDDTYAAMMTPNAWIEVPNFRMQYGLGVIMLETPFGQSVGHSGFFPGYRSEMYYFPEENFSFAVQVNSDTNANMFAVGQMMADAIMKQLGIRDTADE